MTPPFVDRIIAYLPPAVGYAFGNWLGNEGHSMPAAAILGLSALYYLAIIKPTRDFFKKP